MSGFWIIFAVVVAKATAQVPYLGGCPNVKAMDNFDVSRYLGKWYEAERYFSVFEFGGKCVNIDYTDGADATSMNVINKQTSTLTGIESKIEGLVKKPLEKTGPPAEMNVRYPYLPMDAPYWVLDTDYENFAVIWSCSNFGLFSTRNAWILTREREPSLDVMERAYSVLDKNLISRAYFIRTDQKSCSEDH